MSEKSIEEIITGYIVNENVKEGLLNFVGWLRGNEITPLRQYFEGQSPFWEIQCNGKKHYIVWDEKDNISIMLTDCFTNEFQAVILENNLQNIVLDNLQQCTRATGGHCNNCHLPDHVTGVDQVIFGKEVKSLCCGEYVSVDNPSSETIAGIKKLLTL
ncbi:MAG: hypothetical protein FWC90_05490 [Oscillospiraceae bacterium]|nr:hypothetical protein [Oscillospiraceae bacterium]